jgi:magnesium transporter
MIWSWAYLKDGTFLQQVPTSEIRELFSDKGNLLWIDFEDPTEEEINILRNDFIFHPLLVDDCVASHSQPKLDEFEDYIFLVMHSCFFYEEKKLEEALNIRELDIFFGKNFVVTYHRGHIRSVSMNRRRCEQNPRSVSHGADFIFYSLLDSLVDNYFPIVDVMSERLEKIEEDILANPRPELLSRLFALKRSLVTLRKVAGPQRELIGRFSRPGYPFISGKHRPYFKDVYDHILRIYDISESSRELISADMEAYLSSISFKLNEIMKTLTIIATFVMPLTLITGFYGMNIEIPEFGWGIWGYVSVWGIMFLTSIGMLIYFRKRKLI